MMICFYSNSGSTSQIRANAAIQEAFFLTAGACLLSGSPDRTQAAEPVSAPAILQQMRSFRQMGSVLYVAAHPDGRGITLLIAYLARGRDYRTAYLSVTRGDGGQNVLGPEFGEKLGVARTQECSPRAAWTAAGSFSLARLISVFPKILARL